MGDAKCFYFVRGACRFGDRCWFSHESPRAVSAPVTPTPSPEPTGYHSRMAKSSSDISPPRATEKAPEALERAVVQPTPSPYVWVDLSEGERRKLIEMAKSRVAYAARTPNSTRVVAECFAFLAAWRLTTMGVMDQMSVAWALDGARGFQQILNSL